MKRFLHSGDLGDVIYALPAIQVLGGGAIHLVTRSFTKEFTPERVTAIRRLLEFQPYVDSVATWEPENPVTDISTFRGGGLQYGKPLVLTQAEWVDAFVDLSEPWLSAPVSDEMKGKVLVHRSARYHNPYFPWRQVFDFYGDRIVALGFDDEVRDLSKHVGRRVKRRRTEDFLELASLLSGADLFIGNQSSPMSVAMGLGVPAIQETCIWTPDCVLPRANVQYVYDGGVVLPSLTQGENLAIPSFSPEATVNGSEAPPGGWQVVVSGKAFKGVNLLSLVTEIRQWMKDTGEQMSGPDLEALVMRTNAERLRVVRAPALRASLFGRIDRLFQNSRLTSPSYKDNNRTVNPSNTTAAL